MPPKRSKSKERERKRKYRAQLSDEKKENGERKFKRKDEKAQRKKIRR